MSKDRNGYDWIDEMDEKTSYMGLSNVVFQLKNRPDGWSCIKYYSLARRLLKTKNKVKCLLYTKHKSGLIRFIANQRIREKC